MRETWVRSLGREDPFKKEMATYSSTLAWKIPWTEEPCRLQSMGSQKVGHDLETSLSFHVYQASLVAQTVKRLVCLQCRKPVFDPRVRKIAWLRIPWRRTEKADRLQSTGSQNVGHDWATSLSFHLHQGKRLHFLSTFIDYSNLRWIVAARARKGAMRCIKFR